MEPKSKGPKKKKKPLSQNVPSKKEWTLQDAELALSVEKECNKRFKNQSLLIKFPDLELNKEIVSKFHPAIENVHFQQPSAPRFCFVTLNVSYRSDKIYKKFKKFQSSKRKFEKVSKHLENSKNNGVFWKLFVNECLFQESADTDAVIKELSKQRFGDGYITAEYKKDREDDQNVGPEDIDPTTLYVGNLAQEITKEDMVRTFPKVRRIDIGYAKKMKYTRYAFVSFSTVTDAVEAFKKTHSTQLYSKSLIVRFRRLCGPVGMPGETKQQNPQKTPVKENTEITTTEMNGSAAKDPVEQIENTVDVNHSFQEPTSPFSVNNDSLSRSPQYSERHDIKYEPDDSDDDYESKFNVKSEIERDLFSNSVNDIFANHKPKMKTEVKSEVKMEPEEKRNPQMKQEPVEEVDGAASSAIESRREEITANAGKSANVKSDSGEIFRVDGREVIVKEEPREDSGDYTFFLRNNLCRVHMILLIEIIFF